MFVRGTTGFSRGRKASVPDWIIDKEDIHQHVCLCNAKAYSIKTYLNKKIPKKRKKPIYSNRMN